MSRRRLEDAEVVAFRIGEDHPTLVSDLADVGKRGPECDGARHCAVLVVRTQVEMDAGSVDGGRVAAVGVGSVGVGSVGVGSVGVGSADVAAGCELGWTRIAGP